MLLKNLSNIPGWSSKRKLVVIESDDWGSIRMPSNKTLVSLKQKGLSLEKGDSFRYNNYDTLATADDLSCLFEVLTSVKDRGGNHPVITAVSLTSNPDFDKIKANDYQEYFSETFMETLKRYNREDAFKLWQNGVQQKLFVPQFHGREHLNICTWMRALQNKDPQTMIAFEYGCWGFNNVHPFGIKYQAAFDLEKKEDLRVQESVIIEGLKIFEKIHGYKAEFFVPPNGPFNNSLEQVAANGGIKYMSASKVQKEPQGEGKTKLKLHYLGQKNKHGQKYITRNAFFEPSQPGNEHVNKCLYDIALAFKWSKPAVLSTHRVNYVGDLSLKNRDKGLKELSLLLKEVLKRWPDVKFLTSDMLGNEMNIK